MSFYHLLTTVSVSDPGVILGLFLAALFLCVFIQSLFWVYGDAERRGKSGCLVVFLVLLLGWPLSLLVWYVFRPN